MMEAPPRAGHPAHRRQTLAATVAAAGIVQLPTAAIVMALPTIHRQFDVSLAQLQWTVTAFLIPDAAFLIAAGRLSDIFGRRRLLVIGGLVFAAGSVLAALAGGIYLLVAGIALSGVGGAMLMPSSMGIVMNVFTDAGRGVAIGMWGAATELVSGAGVVVGGFLTQELTWRWIFWIDVVVALGLIGLALRGSPESHDPTVARTVDVPGVLLSVSGLTALTLALIQGPSWGWGATQTVVLLVAAAVIFATFAVVERRGTHPIVDFGFFRERNFTGSTVVIFVMDFSFGALLFFLPLYFQEALGYSPLKAGILLLPLTATMVVGSPLGGRVASRTGPRPPIVAGLALMAAAVYLISRLTPDTTFAQLWWPTMMMGFGVGFALTPMNLAAMNAISRDHAGAASGVLVTISGVAATLGVAVTGALFQQLETARTVSFVAARNIPIEAAGARQLDGLLAGSPGATQALARIAGAHAPAARQAVRDAFISALSTSLVLSAALIVVGLVLTVALMRRSRPVDAEVAHPALPPRTRPAPRAAVA